MELIVLLLSLLGLLAIRVRFEAVWSGRAQKTRKVL